MSDDPKKDGIQAPMRRRQFLTLAGAGATLIAASSVGLGEPGSAAAEESEDKEKGRNDRSRAWRAGDHHIHSEYSGDFDITQNPPTFSKGTDAVYPIVTNAIMGKHFGLSWVTCTDHGGPTHSKVNLEQAYPDLLISRRLVPDVLQFWGMELDAPAMDHHTLMIPRHDGEAQQLFELESMFAKRDPFPANPAYDTEAHMIAFLNHAKAMAQKPLVLAHHASRSASGLGVYGQDTPREFRNNHDTAPDIYVGFEGAPGHQAGPLVGGPRGAFGNYPTHGGYDQMTAVVGGLWDSLLGEGRRWWITATSDSHVHWTRGGIDFWPGEYSKTYVNARQEYGDIMNGMRSGRMFVTTGDLITVLDVTANASNRQAMAGETLSVRGSKSEVDIQVSWAPLTGLNGNGERPAVKRVDVIVGQVTGPAADRTSDRNATTRVVARFGEADWKRQGGRLSVTHKLKGISGNFYVRVRGTNTNEDEPQPDGAENPWSDLWFYSNPVFVNFL